MQLDCNPIVLKAEASFVTGILYKPTTAFAKEVDGVQV